MGLVHGLPAMLLASDTTTLATFASATVAATVTSSTVAATFPTSSVSSTTVATPLTSALATSLASTDAVPVGVDGIMRRPRLGV